MQSTIGKYAHLKKETMAYGWQKAKRMRVCYLFLAPYAILFITFFIASRAAFAFS